MMVAINFNNPILALGMPGVPEMILIALVILLLFGAKRLPELARGLGKGIREFRGAVSETSDQLKKAIDEPEEASKPTPPSDSSGVSTSSNNDTKSDNTGSTGA